MLHNRKYHSTRTTDRCVRGLLNKRSDTNPHSTKETQYETFNVKVVLSVTPLLGVKLLLNVTPSLSVKLLLRVKFLLHGKISFQKYTTKQ